MSPETLTVYLEYRERLLERQQRVQMEQLHLKLRHEQELELKKMEFSSAALLLFQNFLR
jgi:hypothetical protein